MSNQPSQIDPTAVNPPSCAGAVATGSPPRARVLHWLYDTDRSGVGLWLLDLLPCLQQAGFTVDIVTPRLQADVLDDAFTDAGVRIWHIGTARNYLRFRAGFRDVVASGGPYQIVHSSLPYGGIQLRLAARCGIPVRIAHSHVDTRPQEAAGDQTTLRRVINNFDRRLVQGFSTKRLAVSAEAAAGLFGPAWQTPGVCDLLPCGRDYSAYRQAVDRHALRAALGLPDHGLVIGHVGRLGTQKNHAFLLQIAAEVQRHAPDTHVLLAGTGELHGEIQRQADALGIGRQLVFAGDRTDIPALLLGAMDVFVFPSLYEGLPTAVLEAQAAGLPCLMADHLADQTIVAPELVQRLSLDAPATSWAAAVLEKGSQPQALDRTAALDRVLASDFAIGPHAAKVIALYESELASAGIS